MTTHGAQWEPQQQPAPVESVVVMPTLPGPGNAGNGGNSAHRATPRTAPTPPPFAPQGPPGNGGGHRPAPTPGRYIGDPSRGSSDTDGPGQHGPLAPRASSVVVVQPTAQTRQFTEVTPEQMRKGKKYVSELNYSDMKQWDAKQVSTKFLVPIGLGKLSPFFEHHRVTGRVLANLKKEDFKDMKIMSVGDRIFLTELVRELQLKYRRDVFNAVVWSGTVPAVEGGIAYFPSIWSYLAYKCCPCLSNTEEYEFSRQGLKIKKNPPACIVCCGDTSNEFNDIRFLKDLDWSTEKQCCGCLTRRVMTMIFLDEGQAAHDGVAPKTKTIPHPNINQEEINKLLFIWSDARLVAGAL